MADTGSIVWYFDFISPFAYLQHRTLRRHQAEQPDLTIDYRPVLFAGLLGHHQHKGPAEIPAKRIMTYQYCHWLAKRLDIPFRMPASHPFNPLPFLRLVIAKHFDPEIIDRLFEHCWVNSANNPEFATMTAIQSVPGCEDAETLCAQPEVKAELRHFTDEAIESGVFGVPTIAVGGQLFWGWDMTDMALAALRDPALLQEPEFQRIATLPIGTARS